MPYGCFFIQLGTAPRASTDRTILAIGLIILFAPSVFVPLHASNGHEFNPRPAGLLVPLYASSTDPSWATLISEKETYPSVPIIAVVNDYGGPGTTIDNQFLNGILKLKAAHIMVIGYVWTHYGARNISDVERDMMKWMAWYNVNGIFFDNMNSSAFAASYYKNLAKFAMSHGFVLTVGNAGGYVDQILMGIFQITCIYEQLGMPSPSDLMKDSGPRSELAYIAYGVPTLPNSLMTQYAAWFWITNLIPPVDYTSLPPYLSQELDLLS